MLQLRFAIFQSRSVSWQLSLKEVGSSWKKTFDSAFTTFEFRMCISFTSKSFHKFQGHYYHNFNFDRQMIKRTKCKKWKVFPINWENFWINYCDLLWICWPFIFHFQNMDAIDEFHWNVYILEIGSIISSFWPSKSEITRLRNNYNLHDHYCWRVVK